MWCGERAAPMAAAMVALTLAGCQSAGSGPSPTATPTGRPTTPSTQAASGEGLSALPGTVSGHLRLQFSGDIVGGVDADAQCGGRFRQGGVSTNVQGGLQYRGQEVQQLIVIAYPTAAGQDPDTLVLQLVPKQGTPFGLQGQLAARPDNSSLRGAIDGSAGSQTPSADARVVGEYSCNP